MTMLIFRILRWISGFISFVCLVASVRILWLCIKESVSSKENAFRYFFSEIAHDLRKLTKHITGLLIVSLFATLITSPVVHEAVGLHNLHLKEEGTYCFYVELNGTAYPAQIRIEKEKVRIQDGRYDTQTTFFLDFVIISQDQQLNFSEPFNGLLIDQTVSVLDDSGREWQCTLLNSHGYSPKIQETSTFCFFPITLLFLELIPTLLVIYAIERQKSIDKKGAKE